MSYTIPAHGRGLIKDGGQQERKELDDLYGICAGVCESIIEVNLVAMSRVTIEIRSTWVILESLFCRARTPDYNGSTQHERRALNFRTSWG